LHENEILRRKGVFRVFNTREKQTHFLEQLTEIIEFSNFVLISATIDKRIIKKPNVDDNAYHIALGMCMEALNEFLAEKEQQHNKTHADSTNKCNYLLSSQS